jgi:hypothetical protein
MRGLRAVVLVRPEGAAKRRLHAQQPKEIRRNVECRKLLRIAQARQDDVPQRADPGNGRESAGAGAHIPQVQNRSPRLQFGLLRLTRFDGHQLAGVVVGQAAQGHRVHHSEYGGVCADPECQSNGRDCREARIAPQEPSGVPEIGPPPRQHSAV